MGGQQVGARAGDKAGSRAGDETSAVIIEGERSTSRVKRLMTRIMHSLL